MANDFLPQVQRHIFRFLYPKYVRQFLHHFQISNPLPNLLMGALQYEEEFEHEAEVLEKEVRKEEKLPELGRIDSIFGFMRQMMEFNSNLYHKMLGVVTEMV